MRGQSQPFAAYQKPSGLPWHGELFGHGQICIRTHHRMLERPQAEVPLKTQGGGSTCAGKVSHLQHIRSHQDCLCMANRLVMVKSASAHTTAC